MKKNAFYAQSGGMTSVINATACGVIESVNNHPGKIGKILIGRHGICGALEEELYDISKESQTEIAALRYTPGGAFGSCRHKLTDFNKNPADYERLIAVFKAHNIGYFFYNGGNDSADTTNKIAISMIAIGTMLLDFISLTLSNLTKNKPLNT